MSSHDGHDMSAHAGHDMSAHAGHDMSAHAGHDMSKQLDQMIADVTTAAPDMETRHAHGHAADHDGSGHYVLTNGHGDGLLQAGVSEVLLFPWAVTDSAGSLLLACLCLLLVAVGLEYLRLLAWWLEVRYGAASACPKADAEDIAPCNGIKPDDEADNSKRTISTISVAALGLLHTVNYIIGTCLMLITMTFNIYIITAIGVGVAVGKIATMFTKRKITGKRC